MFEVTGTPNALGAGLTDLKYGLVIVDARYALTALESGLLIKMR